MIQMRADMNQQEGFPKICNAIMGDTEKHIIEEIKILTEFSVDIFEWRADFFEAVNDPERVRAVLGKFKKAAKGRQIIFSLRSRRQGGKCPIEGEHQKPVFQAVLQSGCADYIELELHDFLPWKQEMLKAAQTAGKQVIVAAYDYEKTPSPEEVATLVRTCEETGADIPKIAVMTHDRGDVLSLLQGMLNVEHQLGEKKRIVVAMGKEGGVSRVVPWLFGSFLTFACGITASVQGQINPNDLKLIINQLKD